MKRLFILLLFVFLFIITGCENKYKNYKQVDLPDSKLGSIKIPINWELFTDNEGWINIKNVDNNLVIAKQYLYGEYYMVGTTTYDTRIYNSYFQDYIFFNFELKSGNSNQGQWGIYSVENNQETFESIYLWFIGRDSDYEIRIIIIDETIDSSIISNIAKSYSRY